MRVQVPPLVRRSRIKKIQIEERDLKKIFRTNTPAARFWRILFRLFRQAIYFFVLFIFFFLVLNYNAYWQRFHYSVAPTPSTKIVITPPAKVTPNYTPELIIPKISVDAPIVMDIPIEQVVSHLEQGVVHVKNSALPGEVGNVVIFGHSSDYPWNPGNFRSIFALLDRMSAGDQIALPYQSQKFIYQVTDKRVVSATDISVIRKTDSPILTLVTCYPVGTSAKRLVITAKLVGGQTTGTQKTDPITTSLPSFH